MRIRSLRAMIVVLAAALAVWGCKKKETVPEVVEPEKPKVEQFPIEEVDEFNYVCVEFEGGYDKHGVVIAKLVAAVKEQEIQLKGPMFGIYRNSPEDVPPDLLKWEVGFPAIVDLEAPPAEPLVAKKWEHARVVAAVYTGPYQGTADLYKKMFAFIDSRDDIEPAGPTLERFLDENPDLVEPDDLRTEVWIPVKEPEPEPEPEAEEAATEGGEEAAPAPEPPAEEAAPAEEPEEKPAKKGKKGK